MDDLLFKELNSLKILHNFDRLKQLAGDHDTAPVTLEIDPVAYCNHHCAWCVDPFHADVSMDLATYKNIINEITNISINGTHIKGVVFKGGGEPTLHEAFGDFLQYAFAHGYKSGIVTNGSRLLKWNSEIINYASYVRVSIDGPTAETHTMIHGSDDFESIITGVRSLSELRKSNRHPIIGLSFAIDIRTVDFIDDAIKLGMQSKVDYILLRPPFFEEVGRQNTMSQEDANIVRQKIRSAASAPCGPMHVIAGDWVGDREHFGTSVQGLAASGRRDLKPLSTPIEHRTGKCFASPLLAVVTADGSLFGCCNLRHLPQWCMGKINYSQGATFASLWAGSQRKKLLEMMKNTNCIKHCTHPLSRYNEMIEILRDNDKFHHEFI